MRRRAFRTEMKRGAARAGISMLKAEEDEEDEARRRRRGSE